MKLGLGRFAPIAAAICVASSSCSVPLQADESAPPIANQCSSNAICGAGGSCQNGACVAVHGAIDKVTLEIIPSDKATFGSGFSFLVDEPNVGVGDSARYVQLPAISRLLLGSVLVDGASPVSGCSYSAATNSVAAHVVLSRIDTARLGASMTSSVDADFRQGQPADPTADSGALAGGVWAFSTVQLAPGIYDLSIRPAGDGGCAVAPLLLHAVPLSPGDTALPLDLPPARTVGGVVNPPTGATLEGWTVDVIEPTLGNSISTSAVLGASAPTNFSVQYRPVQVVSATAGDNGTTRLVMSGDAGGVPYIRISPPSGIIAPTLYWSLSIDIDGDGKVLLDASSLAIAPVHVQGQVQGNHEDGSSESVAASVTFISSLLSGAPPGLTASYGVTAQAGGDGTFSVDLLPGTYRAIAFPAGAAQNSWSITEQDWTVASHEPVPRAFSLGSKPALAGSVTIAGIGGSLAYAQVTATPLVPPGNASVLQSAQAKIQFLPPVASGTTDQNGRFSLPLDAGDFSVAIQPPERSGLPWFVHPNVHVDAGASSAAPTGTFEVPLPVPISGSVYDPERAPLGGAIVRAFAADPDGTSVVEVGETRTNENGEYRLLLPAYFGSQ